MNDALRVQVEASVGQLRALIRRGREYLTRQNCQTTPSQLSFVDSAAAELRIWQRDCAALVNELSGGSKAHWLSRAYSDALLARSATGAALTSASAGDIVGRVIAVLERAIASLSDDDLVARLASGGPPQSPRFNFVHDPALRPVLEQAFASSAAALEAGDFDRSMRTTCGILEAIVTDSLEHARLNGSHSATDLAEGSFSERIAAAERAGLIRNGCARLTPAARAYRDVPSVAIVTERDARVAAQVLRVVMRDLDPGR